MAHKVTPMNPRFVIQRVQTAPPDTRVQEFYAVDDDGASMWVVDTKRATMFMSIHSADLVQKAEGGDIIAITNDDTYDLYRG